MKLANAIADSGGWSLHEPLIPSPCFKLHVLKKSAKRDAFPSMFTQKRNGQKANPKETASFCGDLETILQGQTLKNHALKKEVNPRPIPPQIGPLPVPAPRLDGASIWPTRKANPIPRSSLCCGGALKFIQMGDPQNKLKPANSKRFGNIS